MLITLNVSGQKKVVDLKYLQPYTTQKYQQINHTYYSILYSDYYRQSFCSYYHLTKEMVNCDLERKDCFAVDTMIKGIKIKPVDYVHSGYDKGHLACNADMCFNSKAMTECFYMSNMSPQVHGFNAGIWKKLETQCRTWAIVKGDVFIFTGGVLTKNLKKFSKDSISIPEYFYKIIVFHDNKSDVYETIAFLIPHADIDHYELEDYIVPIDDIESATKIDFLKSLPNTLENEIEKWNKVGNWIIR